GLAYTARFGNGRLGAVAHLCDGLARYHELPQVNGYPFHPSEQDMISAAGIKDQELAIIAEGAGVNHPAIAGRRDLPPRAGGDRYTLFGPAEAVRSAKFLDSGAVDRQRQHSLGRSKGDGRAQPPRILERGDGRPAPPVAWGAAGPPLPLDALPSSLERAAARAAREAVSRPRSSLTIN